MTDKSQEELMDDLKTRVLSIESGIYQFLEDRHVTPLCAVNAMANVLLTALHKCSFSEEDEDIIFKNMRKVYEDEKLKNLDEKKDSQE